MSWAEIKKALNSTLGTDDFESLDRLLVKTTRMISSDILYSALNDAKIEASDGRDSTLILPQKLKMTMQGTARFKGALKRSSVANSRGRFRIFKNGIQVFEWLRNAESGQSTEEFSTDISFSIGDVFSFEMYISPYGNSIKSLTLSNFQICGEVKQNIFNFVE